MKAVAVVIGGAFGKVVDGVVSLVMGSLLQPALKAANVDAIASWGGAGGADQFRSHFICGVLHRSLD
jgi:large-conductance mechanosensitive channel